MLMEPGGFHGLKRATHMALKKARPVLSRALCHRDLLPPVTRQPTVHARFLAPVCLAWLTASAAQTTGATPAVTPAPASPLPAAAEPLPEVVVERDEPKFVAPTRRDRVGRIWAPVMIDGKGPFRLVLDTGASHSAVIQRTADVLKEPPAEEMTLVTGVTGSATVPTVRVASMEVGELLLGPTFLPVVADVFGGAQGVLGREGLAGMRIYADFQHDRLTITRSRNQHASYDFAVVPLRVVHDGLLMADILVGRVRTRAIIDTGAQQTVGNEALRAALLRHPPYGMKRQDIIGVTLDVQQGDNLPTPPIFMGKMSLEGVRVTFGDMYLFQHWDMTHEPTLLVGMDVLGSFDAMVIDYRTRELELRQRNAQSDWLNRPAEPGEYKPF
jgi:predicted aspartyl protease